MKPSFVLSLVCVGALSACGTTSTMSDITPIGMDTFMVARAGGFTTYSGGEVKAQLYRDANAFCQAKGKHLLPLSSSSRDSSAMQYANAELQFRCLSEKDSEYRRPTMTREADTVIKIEK